MGTYGGGRAVSDYSLYRVRDIIRVSNGYWVFSGDWRKTDRINSNGKYAGRGPFFVPDIDGALGRMGLIISARGSTAPVLGAVRRGALRLGAVARRGTARWLGPVTRRLGGVARRCGGAARQFSGGLSRPATAVVPRGWPTRVARRRRLCWRALCVRAWRAE